MTPAVHSPKKICSARRAFVTVLAGLLWAGSAFPADAGINVWTSNGPEGADVSSLAIDPHTPATLYAGTGNAGVFKSGNGGGTWSAVNTGLTDHDVRALAIDPVNPGTLYAGTNNTGVFKSTNGGASWSTASEGLADPEVLALAIDPLTPTTLYAGTWGSGVFKSTNGGGSWSAARTGLPPLSVVESLAIDPLTRTTIYAGTGSNGIYKSTNGGESWSVVKSGTPAVRALAIDPLTPTTVYAGTAGGSSLFKSINGGASWSTANTGLPPGSDVEALAIDPVIPTTIYVGTAGHGVFTGHGVFKSTNGGGSWSSFNTGLGNLFVAALAIDPKTPATVYAGTEAGVFAYQGGGPTKTFTVPPCRVLDTRLSSPLGPVPANTTRTILVAGDLTNGGTVNQGGAAACGVPDTATAVFANIVAVNAAGPGHLTVYPFDSSLPLASTLNFTTGQTIANGVLVPLCPPTVCTSDLNITMGPAAADLVIDVTGYLAPRP